VEYLKEIIVGLKW